MGFIDEVYQFSIGVNIFRKVKKQWELFINNLDFGFFNLNYQIVNVIPKNYGFDMILDIPAGRSLRDFRELIVPLSSYFNSEIIAEYYNGRANILARFHMYSQKIEEKDEIEFKWHTIFSNVRNVNTYGETFNLSFIENEYTSSNIIKAYKYETVIPCELSYSIFREYISDIYDMFGICDIDYQKTERKVFITIPSYSYECIKENDYVSVEITEDITYGGKVIKFPNMKEHKEESEELMT